MRHLKRWDRLTMVVLFGMTLVGVIYGAMIPAKARLSTDATGGFSLCAVNTGEAMIIGMSTVTAHGSPVVITDVTLLGATDATLDEAYVAQLHFEETLIGISYLALEQAGGRDLWQRRAPAIGTDLSPDARYNLILVLSPEPDKYQVFTDVLIRYTDVRGSFEGFLRQAIEYSSHPIGCQMDWEIWDPATPRY